MNVSDIDWLFENIFAGGGEAYPEDEGPEPLNKRFNWVDPKTGKRPPKPPKEMLPGEADFRDLEQTFTVPPTHDDPQSVADVPIRHVEPSDRVGKYSLKDLIPPEELATIDQLLDLKLRAQKARGANRAALDKEFQAHRSEFESLMKKIVDVVLEGAFERSFNKTMRGIDKATKGVEGKIDQMSSELPIGSRVNFKPKHPEDYYDKHSKLMAAERRAHGASQRQPGDPKRVAAAKRAAHRLSGHESNF
jgi:hypothetical protein